MVWRAATERLFERLAALLPARARPAALRIAHTFLDGFASLKTPRLALLVGAGSIGMWGVINVQIYCVMRAFGLDLPLTAAFVVTTAGVLGLAVPDSRRRRRLPRRRSVRADGHSSTCRSTCATGVALVAHAVSFVPISLIGFAFFAASPLKRGKLRPCPRPLRGSRPETAGLRLHLPPKPVFAII